MERTAVLRGKKIKQWEKGSGWRTVMVAEEVIHIAHAVLRSSEGGKTPFKGKSKQASKQAIAPRRAAPQTRDQQKRKERAEARVKIDCSVS